MQRESERIIIRDLEPKDTEAFIHMASDGTLSELFGDCSDCASWMGDWVSEAIGLYKSNNPYHEYLAYAIVDKQSSQVVGAVGCSAYEDLGQIGITYCVGSSFRRQGFAKEAASLFTHYLFENYGQVEKLIATVKTDNIASCNTIEKCGYILEETKMYKDINDVKEEAYNFYFFSREMLVL